MNKKELLKLLGGKEALEKAGLTEDVLDEIIVLHGKGIEAKKTEIAAKDTEIETLQDQLDKAGKTIKEFEKLDPESIKQAAADWQEKAEKFQADAEAAKEAAEKEVAEFMLKTDLKGVIKEKYLAHDPDDVLRLLDLEKIYRGEKDGEFIGLEEQVTPYQESKKHLFRDEEDETIPRIIDSTKTEKINSSVLGQAMMEGAGLVQK